MARRKKKKLSLLGKVKSHLVDAKNWMVDHAHDDEFLPALLWLGGGFMLVFGCLNPWLVLGLDPGTNIDITQKAWKELVAQNHPDRLIAKGVPKELLGMANEKLAIINGAYERIVKAHKMKAGTEI